MHFWLWFCHLTRGRGESCHEQTVTRGPDRSCYAPLPQSCLSPQVQKGPEPIPQHIAGTPQQKQKSRVPAGILPDLESRSSPALGWVESGDSELDAVPGSGQRRIRPVSGDDAEKPQERGNADGVGNMRSIGFWRAGGDICLR